MKRTSFHRFNISRFHHSITPTLQNSLPLAIPVVLLAWFFADVLFFDHLFAWRDVAHYYYPLFRFVQDQWAGGNVPLWNPCDNLGVPLAGDATAGVFYPAKILFLLPFGYDWNFRLYVIGHLLLAVVATYHAARGWRASREAAAVAAMAYAFSGNVLFQYCNIVYLVGAAWLPLALFAAQRTLVRRDWRGAVALGIVVAMMILGGDPQAAYHAGLMATFYAGLLAWSSRGKGAQEVPGEKQPRRPALLVAAGVVGLALAAVQWIPSAEYARRSSRAASSVARNVYELPGRLFGDEHGGSHWADGLLCRNLRPDMHRDHVYHFSVGPWRLAELAWPNFAGRQFPTPRRWIEVLPAEGRVWTPSFYMGLLPFVLAISAMRFRRGEVLNRWLSWGAILAVAASFGWYGLGWILHEIQLAVGRDPTTPWAFGAPVGGVYWLTTVLLPGYIYFRYPAKLLVVSTLALSLLAARGWDRAFAERPARLHRALLWLAGFSVVASAAVTAIRPFWASWLAAVEPNPLLGPFDPAGAANDLTFGLLQTAFVSIVSWLLLRRRGDRHWTRSFAVLLTAVDLAVANGWMVATAPARLWHQQSETAAAIQRHEADHGDGQPYRFFRAPIWLPPAWRESVSSTRIADAIAWDRNTLFPKYHLPEGISLVEVRGALMPNDYAAFLTVTSEKAGDLTVADWFASYAVLPSEGVGSLFSCRPGGFSQRSVPLDMKKDSRPLSACLEVLPDYVSRAWIVHQCEILPELTSNDPEALRRRTLEVFWPQGKPRDLRHGAVLEIVSDNGRWPSATWDVAPGCGEAWPSAKVQETVNERCEVLLHSPSRVEILARLERPGLVVLCDQFYPGWKLHVATDGGPATDAAILRTNRFMRGVWLGAGKHRLTFIYRPASFLWGAMLSIAASAALVTGGIIRRLVAARS
ncbi:MAG: YfhO family protein [Rhodopirellula sp.]|nr:YfhO family protein [Rhodopirellula sp.]